MLWFIGAMILVSPITSGLTGTVYATRAFLLWPFLIIVCGGGLVSIYEWANQPGQKIIWKRAIFLFFISLYIFFFFSRLHQYFLRYPTYAKEAWFDSEKQVAKYLIGHRNEDIDIYSLEGRQVFMEYFFYAKLVPKIVQPALDKKNIRGDIIIENFRFINGCPDFNNKVITKKTIVNTHCVPLNMKLAGEVIKSRDGSDRITWGIFKP